MLQTFPLAVIEVSPVYEECDVGQEKVPQPGRLGGFGPHGIGAALEAQKTGLQGSRLGLHDGHHLGRHIRD